MAKGRKTGGRKAGTPNRLTQDARETFRLMLERLAPDAEAWIRAAAKQNPAKGAELVLRLSELFVPRVQRQPVAVVQGGEPLVVRIKEFTDTDETPVAELERIAAGALDAYR